MIRGTTPTDTFTVGIDLTPAAVINITYKQDDKVVIKKTIEDITADEHTLTVTLTQQETLALAPKEVSIMIRAKFPDGKVVNSNPMINWVIDNQEEEVI